MAKQFTLSDLSPTSIKFKYKQTYFNAPCCVCGKPAVRRVGKQGWCKTHVDGAWDETRRRMANPLRGTDEEEIEDA